MSIETAAYNPMRHFIEVPVSFGDELYILNANNEIETRTVFGFIVRHNGVAFEVCGDDELYYLSKNAFISYPDAIAEQSINKLGLRKPFKSNFMEKAKGEGIK